VLCGFNVVLLTMMISTDMPSEILVRDDLMLALEYVLYYRTLSRFYLFWKKIMRGPGRVPGAIPPWGGGRDFGGTGVGVN
jgi:hypothetical protein